jgi:hypothetical protein
VHTYAEGLFSALAHDLELAASDLTGDASETGDTAVAEVHVQVASLHVVGVLKKGRVDTSVLSSGDRGTIERQIRDEVLAGGEIVARGERDASGRAVVAVRSARGVDRVTCDVALSRENGARARVTGTAEVSLGALGAPPVKGPMGAFRVKDRVRIEFDLVFVGDS